MPLRHLPFFSALTRPSGTSSSDEVLAGLVVLRVVDHWVDLGSEVAGPDSMGGTAARELLASSPLPDDMRDMLRQVLNAVQASGEPDLETVVPRLVAYASMLEGRRAYDLAVDVLETVEEYSNIEAGDPTLTDALLMLARCKARAADLAGAERSYADAAAAARAIRDRARELHAKIGAASTVRRRGNLPRADALLEAITEECVVLGAPDITAGALHEHAIVAQQRGELDRAVCLAYRAIETTTSELHRERLYGDLGAFFVAMGWLDAARDSLLLEEAWAVTDASRIFARVNLLAVAARAADMRAIAHYRQLLEGEPMHPELHVNYLIESARGANLLGDEPGARTLLEGAIAFASDHSLNRASFEATELLRGLGRAEASPAPRAQLPRAAVRVVESLRQSAMELASTSIPA